MRKTQQGNAAVQIVWVLAGIVVIVAAFMVIRHTTSRSAVTFTTPYQAVLLSNGSAYFGKLEGLGTPYPVLHEVYYVQSAQDPQTKKVSNILVKRGKEWHSPDRMVLNANMIVFVEPGKPSPPVA